MKHAAVTIAFLACCLPLASQENATTAASTVYHPPTLAAGTCPIVMGADQGVWNRTVRVREGNKDRIAPPFGQKISLTLKDSQTKRILTATVRVDGLTGKDQVLQTGGKTLNADGTRKLTVKFVPQDDGAVSADLSLPGFTSVTSVELLEVSYADGSTWKVSASDLCRVQPNPMMLITER